jgi:hypothetical protein
MSATAQAFDPAITSPTGDLWQAAIGGPLSVSTAIVNPGQTITVPVSVTPTAAKGSVVSGTLYVDDDSLFAFGSLVPNANQVAAIPYSYRVG